jgi:CRP-like cAMP-binding protein
LFAEMRRPATAIATRPTDVIEINRALMARMLNEFPELAIRLRAFLAGRLSATVSELRKVAQAMNRIGATHRSRVVGVEDPPRQPRSPRRQVTRPLVDKAPASRPGHTLFA